MKYRQAVNTGNGAKDAQAREYHDMAGGLTPCPQKGKRRMSKTKSPITKGEAAELLQSAVNYCQQAGIAVQGYTDSGTLYLSLAGLLLVHTPNGLEFVPVTAGGRGANVPVKAGD